MKNQKIFGTDGIRGRANEEPMSVQTILKVGQAAASAFIKRGKGRHEVVIGKDTRLSGYMYETALASGLCSMGVHVLLTGPLPTPAIAFLTSSMRADAGVIISASHNPFEDNGIKFFGKNGFKLDDATEKSIETLMQEGVIQTVAPSKIGKAKRIEDARGRYIVHLKYHFPQALSLEGLKGVIDCAHGATYKIAPVVFEELGCEVISLGDKPNGKNINDLCGALHPSQMVQKVLETKADFGVAFDGDGDRLVMCDDKGRLFDGDDILAILSLGFRKTDELGAGVVGTVMSNFGTEKYFEKQGIPFFRSDVGDRYVVEKMLQTQSFLGGEPSGHIVPLKKTTTGDGILSSLLVLAQMLRDGKRLSDYFGSVERFPQVIQNVVVKTKAPLESIPSIEAVLKASQIKIKNSGRIVVRYSGTEPKARVMVEGENETQVKQIAADIAGVIQKELGA